MNELTLLIQKVNKTNCMTIFSDSKTVADILAERDRIWDKRIILSHLIENAVIKHDRYSHSEVTIISTIEVANVQKEVDKLAKEFRELDTKIQAMNWTTELI